MKMEAGVDTGGILAQKDEAITPNDTRESLTRRLAELGARLLVETLPGYLAGTLQPYPQPGQGVTYADRLRKEDGKLEWSRSAGELARRARAFSPWPSTYTVWEGQRLKVLEATPVPGWRGDAPPGTVVTLPGGVGVAAGEGALRLETVQLAGKRPMDIGAFVRGQRDFVGSLLGQGRGGD
jgi:methionyl-tRNA formyltransferase